MAAVSVCLTSDFDALSVWVGPRGIRSPNLIARGEFGPIGAGHAIEPGHTIDTCPDICRRVAAEFRADERSAA